MARPLNEESAPDPASSYGREKPEKESGAGRLDNNNKATPTKSPDQMSDAVKNKQPPRQVNAHDEGQSNANGTSAQERRANSGAPGNLPPPEHVDHSMKEEPPSGWDMAPTDIKDPKQKRHPRTEGKGGTP